MRGVHTRSCRTKMDTAVLAPVSTRRLSDVDGVVGDPDDASEAPVMFGQRRGERKKTGMLSWALSGLIYKGKNETAL